MTKFEPGQQVGIRATISSGPFSDESLVSIDTPSGPITGFAKKYDIHWLNEDEGFVRAIVRTVEHDHVTVILAGSYFTTTGIAMLPAIWAANNLEVAEG